MAMKFFALDRELGRVLIIAGTPYNKDSVAANDSCAEISVTMNGSMASNMRLVKQIKWVVLSVLDMVLLIRHKLLNKIALIREMPPPVIK